MAKYFGKSDYERAYAKNQRMLQAAAQDAIDAEYDKKQKDAWNEYKAKRDNLVYQYNQVSMDRGKASQIKAQMKELDKSYSSQVDSIKSERKEAMANTKDLSQYGRDFTPEEFARQAEEDAARKQQRVDNAKAKASGAVESLGGYFGNRNKKEDEGEIIGYNLGQATKNPNAPFGNPNLLNGQDDSNSINLGTFGRIPMNDEQKAQVAEDKAKKDDEKAKASQDKTGGGAFDSGEMQHNVDENGNATFSKKNDNPDFTYHPALEAVRSIKPKDDKDDSSVDDYRNAFGLAGYLSKRFHADDKDPMGRSARLRRQAEMHDIEAGDHQRAMQANNQVANRDYRSEAEKNAASQAAAENAQKVHNLGNAGAGAAALERDVKAADYNTMMQRSDQQRQMGVENMEKMHDMRQTAEEERSGADVYDYTARDMNDYNARSGWLSMGGRQSDKRQRPGERVVRPTETQTPEAPAPESDERIMNANPQRVLDKFVGAWQSGENPEEDDVLDENDQALFDYILEKYPNVKPLPSAQSIREPYYKNLGVWSINNSNGKPNFKPWANAWASVDDEYGTAADKKALIDELVNWRGAEVLTEGNAVNESNTVSSDTGGTEWKGSK